MGIDMKTEAELVAAHADVSEICKIIEVGKPLFLLIERRTPWGTCPLTGFCKLVVKISVGMAKRPPTQKVLLFGTPQTLVVTKGDGENGQALKRQKLNIEEQPKVSSLLTDY
jgi:hypothetical protein